jgi:hypothetical protein
MTAWHDGHGQRQPVNAWHGQIRHGQRQQHQHRPAIAPPELVKGHTHDRPARRPRAAPARQRLARPAHGQRQQHQHRPAIAPHGPA